MEIPVYAMGQWYCPSGNRFYAGIGPYVGYGFSANVDTPAKTKLYKEDAWQEWDFGGKAMVGYELANGIQFNAAYQIGVINAVDKGEGKMLPQSVSLRIGYRF
ncbi:MAG: outer membrane beta-barrel protein [Rikenellaceae bacterium]|nr:outer membrane beta-barrel protein [Rikenellaceae bacterium]